MTEELKQKAHNFALNDMSYGDVEYDVPKSPTEIAEEAYIAGATENGIQWHDLRKDPNDLPNGHRVVLNQVGMATQYDPNRGFLGFGGAGIIAWCEIPTFKV